MSSNFKKTTCFFLCFLVSTGLCAQINLENKAKDLVKEKSETEKAKLWDNTP